MCVSPETESQVCRLLLTFAEGERTVEISRQVLSDNFDFDAYQVFSYLDPERKNRVSADNIVNYLRSKGVCASPREADLLVLFYDQDCDGLLSYCEFLNLVVSQKSNRKNKNFSAGSELPFNVDYSLQKLLEKEINLSRDIISLLTTLRCRCDFNIHEIYHLLKGCTWITLDSIKAFLDRNHASYLDSDVQNILRRLDFNRDGRVDLCELHSFLGFPHCMICNSCNCGCCSCCECLPCSYTCPYHHCCGRCHVHRPCSASSSPARTASPLRSSPLRSSSPLKGGDQFSKSMAVASTNFNTSAPMNLSSSFRNPDDNEVRQISPNLSLRRSPERKFSPNRTSPLRGGNQLNNSGMLRSSNNRANLTTFQPNSQNDQKDKLINYFSEVMKAESEIERSKIDLALRSDFNVEDAFRTFEIDGRGFLTEDDLKYGLNAFGVFPTLSEIRLLMKRFDLSRAGTLSYADFFDIVTPFEKDYRNMVENRAPSSCCACRCPDVFQISTKVYIKNLFNAIINYENKFNDMKKGMALVRCRLPSLFSEIDRYNFGYFGEDDLKAYLKSNFAMTTEKDKDLLFIRLDRNRNGKIELYEIEDEITPQY